MLILNLTQHPATPEQLAAGVVDLKGENVERLKALLTFDEIPDRDTLTVRASDIADIAMVEDEDMEFDGAMIGGAPFLMRALEDALMLAGIKPLYAFSRREASEEVQPDGGVRKTQVFRHLGFVEWGSGS